MNNPIALAILISALTIISIGGIQSTSAFQYANYIDPTEKWSVQYPSDWLVAHSVMTGINGTKVSENISKFIPFASNRIHSNVSISIGVTSRAMNQNQSYTTLFNKNDNLLNCDAYTIAGNKSCVRVFLNINSMNATTTIRGKDYLFNFHGGTQNEFAYMLPVFMQMLATFKPS